MTEHAATSTNPTTSTTWTEKIDVSGGHLAAKVKELVHEGNVRRIVVKDPDGKIVIEVPVTVGVVGLLVAPSIAALGAIAAVAADYSIEIERDMPEGAPPAGTPPTSAPHGAPAAET